MPVHSGGCPDPGIVINRIYSSKILLGEEYDVPVSSIVWMGENKYILVKDGIEMVVEIQIDDF